MNPVYGIETFTWAENSAGVSVQIDALKSEGIFVARVVILFHCTTNPLLGWLADCD